MRNFCRLFGALLLIALTSHATVLQTYSSRPSWETATTGRADVDFESLNISTGGWASYSTAAGITTGGLNIVGVLDVNQYFLYALNPPSGAAEDFGSSTILRGPEMRSNSYLSVTLPSSVTSFGIDLMTYSPDTQSFAILLDGVQVATVTTAARPVRTFFGVTTDAPITEVRLVLTSGTNFVTQGLFDNLAYGAAAGSGEPPPAETPEVGTLAATGTGLILVRYLRRRHRLSQALCGAAA
ncbi:MAG: hypothetical protein IT162_06720 [Bryobacterales bacterium]|nr:hypothetical protein [Bryobacterales bacterium]